jgi:hypothetical protein
MSREERETRRPRPGRCESCDTKLDEYGRCPHQWDGGGPAPRGKHTRVAPDA